MEELIKGIVDRITRQGDTMYVLKIDWCGGEGGPRVRRRWMAVSWMLLVVRRRYIGVKMIASVDRWWWLAIFLRKWGCCTDKVCVDDGDNGCDGLECVEKKIEIMYDYCGRRCVVIKRCCSMFPLIMYK